MIDFSKPLWFIVYELTTYIPFHEGASAIHNRIVDEHPLKWLHTQIREYSKQKPGIQYTYRLMWYTRIEDGYGVDQELLTDLWNATV